MDQNLSITNSEVMESLTKLSQELTSKGPEPEIDSQKGKEVETKPSDLLTFPMAIFPQRIQAIIKAYAHHEGFNEDFLCGAALVIFATAMGNRWAARFTTTMNVSPILFLVLIGEPSSGKTPPLKEMEKPLQKADVESDHIYREQRQEYDNMMQLTAEDRKEQGLPEKPEKPVHHEILVIDSTIEKLFSIMKENPHGILLFINELSKLVMNLNRYGKGSDEAYYIEFYDGNQVKMERKTTGDYINILRPYVSIIGGTQPGLLKKMFSGDKEASGFASRFLKIFPDINHMPMWGTDPMPEEVEKGWDDIISALLKMECKYDGNGEIIPEMLEFSKEAKEVLNVWQKKVSDRWDNADSYMKGICGKLKTYAVRFCLIIHVMRLVCEEVTDETIDAVSAKSACLLADYFFMMDQRVHNIVCALPVDAVHQQLFDALPASFTTADAVEKGKELGISERTVKRFLSNGINGYLLKDKHGVYSKKEY